MLRRYITYKFTNLVASNVMDVIIFTASSIIGPSAGSARKVLKLTFVTLVFSVESIILSFSTFLGLFSLHFLFKVRLCSVEPHLQGFIVFCCLSFHWKYFYVFYN